MLNTGTRNDGASVDGDSMVAVVPVSLACQDHGNSGSRRKSAIACQPCRAKKIRCDVSVTGPPCSNCKLDISNCKVPTANIWRPDKRSYSMMTSDEARSRPRAKRRAISPGNKNHERRLIESKSPEFHEVADEETSPQSAAPISEKTLDGSHTTESSDQDQILSQLGDIDTSIDSLSATQMESDLDPQDFTSSFGGLALFVEELFSQDQRPHHSNESFHLPSFISPLPGRLTTSDMTFLRERGALTIPDTRLRNELLRCYAEFVYPLLPIVDLFDFLSAVNHTNGDHGRISLLLFQGVMFVGTAFIDIGILESSGYTSRKAARKEFFQRVRMLYDFDVENDPITLIQALLLMTSWWETVNDSKDPWHWIGIACSLAYTTGLFQNHHNLLMNTKQQHQWRRIAWSCFTRDKVIALGFNKPPRIKRSELNAPMLTLEDFDIRSLTADQLCTLPDCSLLQDTVKQTDLALMFIAKCELCLCGSDILSEYGPYDPVKHEYMGQGFKKGISSGKKELEAKISLINKIQLHDVQLSTWMQSLPTRYHHTTPSATLLETFGASFIVQRAMLNMMYWSVVSNLDKLSILPFADTAMIQIDDSDPLQVLFHPRARNATLQVSRISRDLRSMNLDRCLYICSIPVMLPVMKLHILDLASVNQETREQALQGFCSSAEVLIKLRPTYDAAEYAIQGIESAIQAADIDMSNLSINEISLSSECQSLQEPKIYAQNIFQIISAARVASIARYGYFPGSGSVTFDTTGFVNQEESSIDIDQFLDYSELTTDVSGTESRPNNDLVNKEDTDANTDFTWEEEYYDEFLFRIGSRIITSQS